nr:GPN-loop GTPase 3 isoform X4 [Malus domestica]
MWDITQSFLCRLIALVCTNTVRLLGGVSILLIWILLRKILITLWPWILGSLFPWRMLWRNLVWVPMVDFYTAWKNLDEWLTEELDNYTDDDYLVFDCPGQIELFSHVPVLRNFVEHLQRKNFKVCVVYLLDSQFITDVTKFISGCMASLSAMIQLELPHVNILSKMDLAPRKKDIEDFLYPEPQVLLSELNQRMAPQFAKLNKSLIELVDDYSMVSFLPLDLRKSSSMSYVLWLRSIPAFSSEKMPM